ncbi:TROVE domain-containing protein [Dactylosporangium aurantiacum]|uniref:TROVE domain-containing protein n=1 Tax=Dactylosporangium aurantiacum TaxID=35754 RepID=A0A9Q9IHK8_9ACTN|nr:TROVE domain-containing protein [Dactylosporangium aurantiacum]MDG6104638.1 TROVE domain-containing protein [Dactylosporangium aurantiacum]UWZ56237.1 TROVE domain-containing protein [Dactylosporangium aurantiacum]
MAKFNRQRTRRPDGVTYQGGAGYARDPRSELFLLAVANMVGEQTFYEPGADRDQRYRELIAAAAVAHPQWTAALLRWLRGGANLRTAALVGAAEYVRARLAAGLVNGTGEHRRVVADVLQRADEPGELLSYWTSRYGRAVPKPVKRGVADAARRLYTQRSLLKYDTASHAFRFGDVLDLTHPSPSGPAQGDLFTFALDRRHARPEPRVAASLATVAANAALRADAADDPAVLLDPQRLRVAGMTWEDALSLGGSRLPKAALWEAMIPSMGYMSCLRNLRNFDQAGVSDEVAAGVAARLADPGEVARSRQLPMRFLSAYRAAPSLRWAWALEQALNLSLANIPYLPGDTLILIDTSGSMHSPFSKDGTLMRWDAAVLFGLALALRCERAKVVSFSTRTTVFPVQRGESLLRGIDRFKAKGHFHNGGTNTASAVREHYRGQHRVVILTDEQASFDGDVSTSVPATTPLFTWNLAGYRMGHTPQARNRWTFGGLTDAGFGMITLLEAGERGDWPF